MKALIVTASLVIAAPACAEITGNQLHELCQSSRGRELAFMYAAGVTDATKTLMEGLAAMQMICFPAGVSNQQVVDLVCNSVRDRPQDRHKIAFSSVSAALVGGFPCKPASQ